MEPCTSGSEVCLRTGIARRFQSKLESNIDDAVNPFFSDGLVAILDIFILVDWNDFAGARQE